jgi:hypothetical protein
MRDTIKENKKVIGQYDEALTHFQNTCRRILANEVKRLEDERLHAEAVAANAGKELDYFESPELETEKRFHARA